MAIVNSCGTVGQQGTNVCFNDEACSLALGYICEFCKKLFLTQNK